jgi:EAL domain-containing protein (putative c-di-GMP-specific phosphodiesterase class I)
MGHTTSHGRAFWALAIASTAAAVGLFLLDVGDLWIVAYAALSPLAFRLVLSAWFAPGAPWRAVAVWGAMRRRELVLHYQPLVELSSGHTVAVEALARWEHPRRGLLLPGTWLAATESPFLEMRFCRYVLDAALRQAWMWRQEGRDLLIQVNVSPPCFVDRRFPRYVAELLERWDVPASVIAIEITEASLDLPERALAIADQITSMGISLALDDFGTGHSSMARLVRLPAAEIKIDKSFVIGMLGSDRRSAVVTSTVSLGHGLRMGVVAEGVESAATCARLADMGCDIAQGFHFSRALPPDELIGFLAEHATLATGWPARVP